MLWPRFALKGRNSDVGVTNVRNARARQSGSPSTKPVRSPPHFCSLTQRHSGPILGNCERRLFPIGPLRAALPRTSEGAGPFRRRVHRSAS